MLLRPRRHAARVRRRPPGRRRADQTAKPHSSGPGRGLVRIPAPITSTPVAVRQRQNQQSWQTLDKSWPEDCPKFTGRSIACIAQFCSPDLAASRRSRADLAAGSGRANARNETPARWLRKLVRTSLLFSFCFLLSALFIKFRSLQLDGNGRGVFFHTTYQPIFFHPSYENNLRFS